MMHVREGLTVKKVAGWILVLLMLAGCAAPKPKPPEERPPEPAPVELQWQVQNPLPSGAAYAGVVVGNGTLVAVGQRGTVLAGPARGGVFTIRPSGTEKDLKAVAFGGNRFVAVGAAGTVVSSLDGVAWAPAASGTDQDLGAVAFGNGRFVAVSRDGAVLTSTDGQTWTKGELPPSPGKVGGLAFGAGLFVVVDEAGRLAGVITLGDVRAVPLDRRLGTPVTAVMARELVTVTPEQTLADAALLMARRGVGRLPVVVSLEALDEDALMRILVEPKNALTKQYKKLFELEDVGLTFDPDSLRAVAVKALKRGTGARGLRSILETMMTDIMYDLPNREDVREIVITKEAITEGTSPLIVTERARTKREA
jgi:CBS domain-containing protein